MHALPTPAQSDVPLIYRHGTSGNPNLPCQALRGWVASGFRGNSAHFRHKVQTLPSCRWSHFPPLLKAG
jgi:hypothetical protein